MMKKTKCIMGGILDVILVLLAMAVFLVAFIITLPVILVGWIVIVPLLTMVSKLDKYETSLCKTIIYSTKAFLSNMTKCLENIVSKIGS